MPQHDSYTQDFWMEFGADVTAVGAGGPCSCRLVDEVFSINCASLDEGAGEGYHRSSNMVRQRAPNASLECIK